MNQSLDDTDKGILKPYNTKEMKPVPGYPRMPYKSVPKFMKLLNKLNPVGGILEMMQMMFDPNYGGDETYQCPMAFINNQKSLINTNAASGQTNCIVGVFMQFAEGKSKSFALLK